MTVQEVQHIDRARFQCEWQEWRFAHERALAAPHGFLAVTGLYWLAPTPERFPGAPGEWSSDETGPKSSWPMARP